MYQAINKNLNKSVREREEINKIEFDNNNFKKVTEIRKQANKKVEFYMNLRKAISKK